MSRRQLHEAAYSDTYLVAFPVRACGMEALDESLQRTEVNPRKAGPTWVRVPGNAEQERLEQRQRENKELRRANWIVNKASACFAQAELDRRPR